ncbi:MAG: hypothetical protein JWN75_197 [Candidatus Saccharibacteria bacterium]|nr:hypothetical protein [Candidatus Saccharibacteria bacterium]
MPGNYEPQSEPAFPVGGSIDGLALARQHDGEPVDLHDHGNDESALLAIGYSRQEIRTGLTDELSDPRRERLARYMGGQVTDNQGYREGLWNTEDTQEIDLSALHRRLAREEPTSQTHEEQMRQFHEKRDTAKRELDYVIEGLNLPQIHRLIEHAQLLRDAGSI